MLRSLLFITCVLYSSSIAFAQKTLHLKDSITVSVLQRYDSVSGIHRKVFGENYRKEWAANTRLPVIKISGIRGGLTPAKLGGGHQSHSLRLEESSGKEWILRSVEKYSEGLAPELVKGSLYEKWIDDNFSAQHPYSALIVPVLADALRIPHTNPVIGWVAPDKALGKFAEQFAGTICLLEERDPEGDSDNTIKMLAELDEDNDHKIDSSAFFRARLLDLLIADWGRHEDQWRWVDTKKGDGKDYLAIPRDRDQVLYVNEGILPKAVASVSPLSFLEGFNSSYKDPNAFFINGRKLNQQFLNQYSYEEWMQMTRDAVSALPDDILKRAVQQLPLTSYALKGDLIFSKLQGRRDNLLNAMDTYYRFLYRIIDIRTSDKAEQVEINENTDGAVNLSVFKIANSGVKKEVLFNNTFKPGITREIRLFVGEGNDVIHINVPTSPIKLRVVGGKGEKHYEVKNAATKADIYENQDNDQFLDPHKRLVKHISSDTLNVKKAFSNLYLGSGVTPLADLRSIDGISLGLAYKIKKEGFRKEPYGSMQKISASHSLSTKSFVAEYKAEWKEILRNTDFIINGLADMNGNILNFFGRGNDTEFNQTGDFRRFYRVNYSFYRLDPAIRISFQNNVSITTGLSFQYFVNGNNAGRYITYLQVNNAFNKLFSDKFHGGLFVNFSWDKRDHKLFPTKGFSFNLLLQGYEGLNKSSSAFAQIFPQVSFYKSLDPKGNIVIANRTGAGFTTGTTTFYQSAFLGSQDNLLGFRKNRFAGDHVLYNNIEARINLPNFVHNILPGKIGFIGFYDAGRVWVKKESSDTFHHGVGGGFYFAPFNHLFVRAIAGYSNEGLQPTLTLKQRF
ncbi:MAG: BamA/TamA family outer membrane protein [Daejeonella sp.]